MYAPPAGLKKETLIQIQKDCSFQARFFTFPGSHLTVSRQCLAAKLHDAKYITA